MQGEMSQGRNVAQGEMSLREKCRREKSRREKCRREKCLLGRNVVQSYGDMTVNTLEVHVNTKDSINVHDRAHTYFFVDLFSYVLHCMQKCQQSHIWKMKISI